MGVVIRTERDLDSGVTTVRLGGELTWATAASVRAALAKCVVECPVAVIVELSGLRAARSGVLSVLPTAARRAARDHGVPLVLCAPRPEHAGPLAASRTFAQVYTSYGDALAMTVLSPCLRTHAIVVQQCPGLRPAPTSAANASSDPVSHLRC